MASSEKLQNEILLKEEAFLKEEKSKLTEQLNRLKVEERALVKLLLSDDPPCQHTMQFFNQNLQSAEPLSLGQRMDSGNFEVEIEVNRIPLQGLDTRQIMQVDGEEEEEEEDTDNEDMEEAKTPYSLQLMNAVSNLHDQDPVDQDLSRSVLQSILQQEVGDLGGEDEYF